MDSNRKNTISPQPDDLVGGLRREDAEAIGRLDELLRDRLRREVARFLGTDAAEVDDIVQTSIMAILEYVKRDVQFEGDVVSLAITIARNRCRDLSRRAARWRHDEDRDGVAEIVDQRPSELDRLETEESSQLLQTALDMLDTGCRELLSALFVEDISAEAMRKELGLGSVQAVHYRKRACLKKIEKFFQELDSRRSLSEARHESGGGRRRES